jgi:transposase
MLERSRFIVGDAAWEKIAPLLPGKASDPGATAKDNRLFLEAVLWRVRTGVPWRDLPSGFGSALVRSPRTTMQLGAPCSSLT